MVKSHPVQCIYV